MSPSPLAFRTVTGLLVDADLDKSAGQLSQIPCCNSPNVKTAADRSVARSPAAEPSIGKYLFDGGKTVFLACSTVDFTYMASVSNGASLVPTLPIQPSSAMGSVTTTPPGTLSTTTPAASTTPPAQDGTGSSSGSSSSDDGNNGKDTVEIVAIVVGGVVCLVAFLFTGYIALRIWQIHNSRYTPMRPTMSHSSAAQEPREPLNTWAKVAGVGSFLVGLAGLVVAIYFGIRHS